MSRVGPVRQLSSSFSFFLFLPHFTFFLFLVSFSFFNLYIHSPTEFPRSMSSLPPNADWERPPLPTFCLARRGGGGLAAIVEFVGRAILARAAGGSTAAALAVKPPLRMGIFTVTGGDRARIVAERDGGVRSANCRRS